MRTTIAIDDGLLAELMRAEPDVSRSEAIRRAVHDYLRRRRVQNFMKLAGSRLVDLDWRDVERQALEELPKMRRAVNRQRHGRKH